MAKKSGLFIRQFVIGLGFLSGIFTAIGIDPQVILLRIIGNAVGSVYPDPQVSYMFFILPTVLLLVSLIAAFRKGKVLGLVSVIVAYCSGVLIFISAVLSIMLLLLAVALGFFATNRRLLKKVKL